MDDEKDNEDMLNPDQMSEEESSITFNGRRRALSWTCHKGCDDSTPVGAKVVTEQTKSPLSHL